jgi:hypothetical protein
MSASANWVGVSLGNALALGSRIDSARAVAPVSNSARAAAAETAGRRDAASARRRQIVGLRVVLGVEERRDARNFSSRLIGCTASALV